MASWGFEDDAILHGLENRRVHPTSEILPYTQDKLDSKKCKNLSSTKRKRKRSKKEDKLTPKRPRSPYNLFFHVERELIMAELNCSPGSNALSGHKPNNFPQESLALEDAIPNTPLPDCYRGANLLNPIVAIKNGTRKHRKVHGKIGFVQLSQTIAQRWKTADEDVKDFFKMLSKKDLKRYKIELDQSNDCNKLAANDDERVSKPSITKRNQMADDKSSKRKKILVVNQKIKPMKDTAHPKGCCKQCHSMSLEPTQTETLTATQDILEKEQVKVSGEQGSRALMYETPHQSECIENKVIESLDSSDYEPLMFPPQLSLSNLSKPCLNGSDHCGLNDGNLDASLESGVKDEIRQFLSYIVSE